MQLFPILTILILAIVAILSAAMFLRKKLFSAMSVGLKVVYVLALIGVITALLAPQLYHFSADKALRLGGVYDQVADLDERFVLVNIVNGSSDVVGGIRDQVNGLLDDLLNRPQEKPSEDTIETEENAEEGYFTENLYPIFVNVLAGFLRVTSLIVSLLLLLLVVYVSYGMGGAGDIARLEASVAKLEAKVAELESRTPTTN